MAVVVFVVVGSCHSIFPLLLLLLLLKFPFLYFGTKDRKKMNLFSGFRFLLSASPLFLYFLNTHLRLRCTLMIAKVRKIKEDAKSCVIQIKHMTRIHPFLR